LRPLRPAVAAAQQLLHLAVVADHHSGEAVEPPVLADRVAVDVVDEGVGERGGGEREEQGEKRRDYPPPCKGGV